MGAAAGLGLLWCHPQRIVVDGSEDDVAGSLLSRLRTVLGVPVVASFSIGPVRAVQKPVLHLLSPNGESIAFVKVGTTAFTKELIAREARALVMLASEPWETMRVPALLSHETWRDLEVLVQGALAADGPRMPL